MHLAVDPDYQRRGRAKALPAFYAKYGFKKETEVILIGAEL